MYLTLLLLNSGCLQIITATTIRVIHGDNGISNQLHNIRNVDVSIIIISFRLNLP